MGHGKAEETREIATRPRDSVGTVVSCSNGLWSLLKDLYTREWARRTAGEGYEEETSGEQDGSGI